MMTDDRWNETSHFWRVTFTEALENVVNNNAPQNNECMILANSLESHAVFHSLTRNLYFIVIAIEIGMYATLYDGVAYVPKWYVSDFMLIEVYFRSSFIRCTLICQTRWHCFRSWNSVVNLGFAFRAGCERDLFHWPLGAFTQTPHRHTVAIVLWKTLSASDVNYKNVCRFSQSYTISYLHVFIYGLLTDTISGKSQMVISTIVRFNMDWPPFVEST